MIVRYNQVYEITLKLSRENRKEEGFFYVEKSRLVNALKVEPGITYPTKGETHNYSGPLRPFSWNSVLETLDKRGLVSMATLSNEEEIIIPVEQGEYVKP